MVPVPHQDNEIQRRKESEWLRANEVIQTRNPPGCIDSATYQDREFLETGFPATQAKPLATSLLLAGNGKQLLPRPAAFRLPTIMQRVNPLKPLSTTKQPEHASQRSYSFLPSRSTVLARETFTFRDRSHSVRVITITSLAISKPLRIR